MSDSHIEVITAQTEDQITGIVIEDIPYLYWLRVYKALGLKADHAARIIRRLEEGTHYIRFSKHEFEEKYPTIDTVSMVDLHASAFYFLTEEGYNRAIMEIRTCEMDNRDVAAAIDAKKDHMASIYTRYQKGEVLSKIADETPALPPVRYAETSLPEDRDAAYIRFATQMNQFIRKMGADRNAANAVTIEMVRENCETSTHPFLAAIPIDPVHTPPDDAAHDRRGAANILKVTLDRLDDKLIELGWSIRSPKGWLVTPKGSQYLKQDRELGVKGKTRFDVRFGIDALHLLKKEFEQRILSAGYLSSCSCVRGTIPVSGAE